MKKFILILFLLTFPFSIFSQGDNIKLFKVMGLWAGAMPCADCEAISYRLNLKRNFTFMDQMTYEGKNVDKLIADGNWRFVNDSTIEINASNGTKNVYRLLSDVEMVMLDGKGNPMPSPQPGMFYLTKLSRGGLKEEMSKLNEFDDTKAMNKEKMKMGIDFIATGNEPFWSLEIDLEKGMRFTSFAEVTEVTIGVPVRVPITTDVAGVSYVTKTDSFIVNASLFKQECTDNMSGEKSPYTVTVSIQNKYDNVAKEFKGCGRYLYDNDLNKIWTMTKFKNTNLYEKDFMNGLPNMKFDLEAGRVYGFAGCNSFNGAAEAMGDQIKFGKNFITTRLACLLKIEQKILNALSGKTLSYEIAGDVLKLKDGKQTLFELVESKEK